jgi:hypothetical protein
MKQNSPPPEGQPKEALRQRRERALSRQRKRREQQQKSESGERRAIFERRLKKASARKAPFTLRTRGYYRFSRDFPGNVDETGLRENRSGRKRAVLRGILWAIGLIAVFCVSFTLAKAAWLVSNEPPAVTGPTEPADTEMTAFRALHFSRGDMEDAGEAYVKQALKDAGAAVAVFEVKDAEGYVYVYTDLLRELHADGIRAAAYISCFQDSVHTWETPALSVRSLNENGGVWTDNAGAGWLNPFSPEARALLLDTVKNAADAGFDYILLDHVCFPADSGSATAFYAGESEYHGTRNQVLTAFVSDAVAAAGKAGTILLTRIGAFDPTFSADRAPTYGDLLHTAAGMLAADARLSRQQKNQTVGEETFADPADIPYAFTLAVGEFALQNAENTRVLLCVDRNESAEETLKAADFAGVYGWILW